MQIQTINITKHENGLIQNIYCIMLISILIFVIFCCFAVVILYFYQTSQICFFSGEIITQLLSETALSIREMKDFNFSTVIFLMVNAIFLLPLANRKHKK